MSTVIEKITLYDFFGYLIPGITFETLLCGDYLVSLGSENAVETVTQMTGIGGSFYIIFFLMGYVLGLLLSEIAARFYGMVRWLWRKLCRFADSKNLRGKSSGASKINVSESVIRKALVNSGLVEEDEAKLTRTENLKTTAHDELKTIADNEMKMAADNAVNSTGVEKLLEKYSQLMYSNIQTDPNYKRIHEYYSFATMCKNLSAAFALAAIMSIYVMAGCDACRIVWIASVQLLAAIIFSVRYQRFYHKKQTYTVYWFVAKNQNRTEKTEAEKR